MADLNGLKLVNDTYGHCVGDDMLKCAADILKKSCRKEDLIGRWGGDEFVILLPQTSRRKAEAVSTRIKERCSKANIRDIPISMAIGIACKEKPGKNLIEILKEAEDSMYKQKLTESRSEKSAMVSTLLKTLEEKSFETKAHTRRMEEVAVQIGERIGLSPSELNRLKLVITLHDIGKTNIPEEILTREGPLTEEEWEIMKKHPETGFKIARATEEFSHVAKEIMAHHERWDGTGYPRGLKGEDIPLLARIIAIANAYEVMTQGRPYKKPLSLEKALDELKKCAGTQFDPELVEVFLEVLEGIIK
ncbi:MAG: diguanylate cyclase [Candidatus Syntrophonatronum acetioxidans]|uniref:Diguanylate cyclase n=1 Tax=Candidatus Syntrophonatronum acetioxidans TaxID=1795816 RepID=A0A424YAG1_9FIRM|nr:MAG: diguanylate cyclase [Candidatus Syntrophonatronum acetioxidans]